MGVAGVCVCWQVIVLLGFSNVIADGVAMGVGDFLSTKAENDHALAERKREGARQVVRVVRVLLRPLLTSKYPCPVGVCRVGVRQPP